MIPSADIIRQLLLDLSIVTTTGDWTCYASFLPDKPYKAVVVYDTAGTQDARCMNGQQNEHFGIQVRVRGGDYTETFTKAQAIAAALDAVYGTTVTVDEVDYDVQNVSRTGTIIPLGVIEEGEHVVHHFTLNAVLTVAEAA